MGGLLTTGALEVLLVSFGIGIVVGLTGIGGGALMTPALIFLGIPPTAAVANDLVASAVNRSTGAAVHWRSGAADMRLARWLVVGSVPAALVGAFSLKFLEPLGDPNDWLRVAIGITLLIAAGTYVLRMYVNLLGPSGPRQEAGPTVIRPMTTISIGIVGGLLVGLTSVGSGSLIMVALLLLYPTMSAQRMVGTNMVQAVPLVVAAAIGHVVVSGVDWDVLVPLGIGSTVGTYLGARMAARVPQSVIRRGIVLVLTLTALMLLHVPSGWVGVIGAALVILGPAAWSLAKDRVRRHSQVPYTDDDEPPV